MTPPSPSTPTACATVFGLDVATDVDLPFLSRPPAQAPAAPTGRTLDLSVAGADSPAPDWPDSAELVCDERQPDGAVNFRIEAHPEAGYLLWGPDYGRHLVSPDGARVLCLPGDCAADAWQRLLIAQVLPFAALLHGLEILHASAVVHGGGAIAFVGPSGAGKTSVALELCRRGASFLADDVLALERTGGDLLAHPGTPLAGLDHAEARRLTQVDAAQPGEIVAVNDRERLVRMHGAAGPTPLAALFFVDRRPDARGEPRFEPAADPQLLLAATFNSVLRTPRRLRELLEVCALIADRRVERIAIGSDVDAAQLAAAIERRLGGAA
jgi:hypothetical protein